MKVDMNKVCEVVSNTGKVIGSIAILGALILLSPAEEDLRVVTPTYKYVYTYTDAIEVCMGKFGPYWRDDIIKLIKKNQSNDYYRLVYKSISDTDSFYTVKNDIKTINQTIGQD